MMSWNVSVRRVPDISDHKKGTDHTDHTDQPHNADIDDLQSQKMCVRGDRICGCSFYV